MRRRPLLLDLYCCAGGSSVGYHNAGFDIVGMDRDPQPNFPFEFIQGAAEHLDPSFFFGFAAISASPPCQAYTIAQRINRNKHPDLVAITREKLQASGLPWVIENVVRAPLINPAMLCGSMFPHLRTYRHRLFETNFPLVAPPHPEHIAPVRKMGRPPQEGDFMHVVGNFSGIAQARKAMGIDWMTRDELREAIPPAYTEFVGQQLMRHIYARS